MKHLDIIIPTRNRLTQLDRLINSVPMSEKNFAIKVMFDNDIKGKELFDNKYKNNKKIISYNSQGHWGSVKCRNELAKTCEDGLLMLCDDIEFQEGFNIQQLIDEFNTQFNDDDGVIGIKQNLPEYHPTGVVLIGQKFLNSYPDKQFLNPNYWLFACPEIYWKAEKERKFYQSQVTVNHYHPAYTKKIDRTHRDGRIKAHVDKSIKQERLKKGLIWGL